MKRKISDSSQAPLPATYLESGWSFEVELNYFWMGVVGRSVGRRSRIYTGVLVRPYLCMFYWNLFPVIPQFLGWR